ncbi:hypothetical protein PENTCL1PPCAC_15495, partial [Pristionchus entomophagus]
EASGSSAWTAHPTTRSRECILDRDATGSSSTASLECQIVDPVRIADSSSAGRSRGSRTAFRSGRRQMHSIRLCPDTLRGVRCRPPVPHSNSAIRSSISS